MIRRALPVLAWLAMLTAWAGGTLGLIACFGHPLAICPGWPDCHGAPAPQPKGLER